MAWDSYLEKNQGRFVEELRSFISIPSVSAADEHFEDVVKAGEWVASKLQSIGISNARLMKTQTHPVVYGDWLNAGENKPTILIYGHFDVQPADPYDLWDSPPFEPLVKDGKIYGRGASDDKGNMLAKTPECTADATLTYEGELASGNPINVILQFIRRGEFMQRVSNNPFVDTVPELSLIHI